MSAGDTLPLCTIAWDPSLHSACFADVQHSCKRVEVCCIAAWQIDAHLRCHMHDLVYHCAAPLYMLLVYVDGIAELWLMTLSILMTHPIYAMVFNGA